MNDARFPWCILVPRRVGIQEIYELDVSDQYHLIQECSCVSRTLMGLFQGDKINIAALGNKVPQLHVHCIVRFQSDCAWPGPVWGQGTGVAYKENELISLLECLRKVFGF